MAKNEIAEGVFPVYLPIATLKSAIRSLRAHGLPPKIDRSAFGSRSGADQGQIMKAFRFLGFIDEHDNTQPILKKLYDCEEGSDEEKQIFAEILKSSYANVFQSVDLRTATPAQLSEAIGSYGPTGSTRQRGVRFFIKAAEFAGLPLSGHLTRGTRERELSSTALRSNTTGTRSPRKKRRLGTPPPHENAGGAGFESAMKTISLPIAQGTLSLSGSFNPFELVGEERELVYQIIDKMNEYEQKVKAETPGE